MNGIYLYGIRQFPGGAMKSTGMGGSKVFTISYKDIEGIVSSIDTEEINTKEIAKKAAEDVEWIINQSKIHERVVERAMGIMSHTSEIMHLKSIIPMKFGTIFENRQNLESMLQRDYRRLRALLDTLQGKQEWSVKVYVREAALEKKMKATEQKVQRKIEQTKNLPRGADYFGELEVKKELDKVMQGKVDELSKKFFTSLGAYSVGSRKNKVLSKDFSGHKEPMVLNGVYFVNEEQTRDFIKQTKSLQALHPEFLFEYTGPWPPYNFI